VGSPLSGPAGTWCRRWLICCGRREALADRHPWPRLVRAFPELLDAPAAVLEDGRAQLIRLYRAYCAEWSAVQSILAPTVVPRPEPGRA